MYLLHSDIQGYELEMLSGASNSLAAGKINYIFISTHSDELHEQCINEISKYNYEIEVSSLPSSHSTCGDGFILGRKSDATPILPGFQPMGRLDIATSSSGKIAKYIFETQQLLR